MSTIEITSKIEALKELEALIEEAKAEAETLRDEIKTEMLNRNTEEMEAGQYIVRWTSVLSQRFDSCGLPTTFWIPWLTASAQGQMFPTTPMGNGTLL